MTLSETVPCPLCGAEETDVLFRGEGYAMGKCRGCRLVRQNPRLTEEALRRLDYDAAPPPDRPLVVRPTAYQGLEAWESKPVGAFLAGVDAVESVRGNGEGKGLWIDVGCSSGGMLAAARSRGWQVAGAEIGRHLVQVCREQHGFDVRLGTLREAAFAEHSADVVSYRQVLEHVHDLAGELAEVRRVLKPGGLLLVEVPHFGGVKYRTDAVRAALRIMPRHRTLHNVPQHLYYFTGRQLERLLAEAGFEALFTRTYGRFRERRGPVRRAYDALRDRLRMGNKLRVVARRAATA